MSQQLPYRPPTTQLRTLANTTHNSLLSSVNTPTSLSTTIKQFTALDAVLERTQKSLERVEEGVEELKDRAESVKEVLGDVVGGTLKDRETGSM